MLCHVAGSGAIFLLEEFYEHESSLIALGSNLLVNLNICKAIRCITTFGNGNLLSSLNKGSVYAVDYVTYMSWSYFRSY